jgi:hypothetical protein
MRKLEPCKYCGGEGKAHIGYETAYIQCTRCGAKSETYLGDYYDEGQMDDLEASEFWNEGKVYPSKTHDVIKINDTMVVVLPKNKKGEKNEAI